MYSRCALLDNLAMYYSYDVYLWKDFTKKQFNFIVAAINCPLNQLERSPFKTSTFQACRKSKETVMENLKDIFVLYFTKCRGASVEVCNCQIFYRYTTLIVVPRYFWALKHDIAVKWSQIVIWNSDLNVFFLFHPISPKIPLRLLSFTGRTRKIENDADMTACTTPKDERTLISNAVPKSNLSILLKLRSIRLWHLQVSNHSRLRSCDNSKNA